MLHIPEILDETNHLLREQIENFAKSEIAPLAEKLDAENQFPQKLWQKIGNMGFLGMTVNEAYGGVNLGYLSHCIAMEEISRASASVGLSYGAHSNLCVNQIHLHGNETQKQKYLPKLVSGEHVGALAMSEAGAGSDIVSLKTTSTKQGDYYLLNGNKMWITNGIEASVYVVYAKTEPKDGKNGITAFIVDRDSEGFIRAQKLDKLGMRGSNTCELVFQDCRVPEENILGELNHGVRVLMGGLDFERTVLAAGPLGILRACLDAVLAYIHDRKQFGQAIGEFQLIQAKVADLYTDYCASRSYVHLVAKLCDEGRVTRQDSAGCILYAAERATLKTTGRFTLLIFRVVRFSIHLREGIEMNGRKRCCFIPLKRVLNRVSFIDCAGFFRDALRLV